MSTEAINRQRADAVSKEDRNERAMRAVKVFRSMQHGLTSYARAITGNPRVRVEVSTGTPRTDGEVIFYRPPIRLGDDLRHDKMLCDKRDEATGLLKCPSCAVREEVLVNIYHEIAHIAFDTFAETTDVERSEAIKLAIEEWGTSYASKIEQSINSAPAHIKSSYLGLARLISPFLPHLVNCLEDARVDSSMFAARKGTRKMLMADTYSLIRDGIPQTDGSVLHWSEAPLNSQAGIACYLEGAGYKGWQQYLHPQVGEDFADPELMDLLVELRGAETASETYALAFPILARLRQLGYFYMPDEQPDEQDDTEEQDEQEEESPSTDGEEAPEQGGVSGDGVESSDTDDDTSGQEDQQPDPGDGGGADEAPGADDDGAQGDSSGAPDEGEPAPENEGDGRAEAGDADAPSDADDDGDESGDGAADPGAGIGDDDQSGEAASDAPVEGEAGDDGDDDLRDEGEASGADAAGPESSDTPEPDEPVGGEAGDDPSEGGEVDADSDGLPESSDGDGGESADDQADGDAGQSGRDDAESDSEPDEGSESDGDPVGSSEPGGVPGSADEVDDADDHEPEEASGELDSGGQGEVPDPGLDNELEGRDDGAGSGEDEVPGDEASSEGGAGSDLGGIDYSQEGDGDSTERLESGPDAEGDEPDSNRGPEADEDDVAEAIDSEADQGLGGIRVEEIDRPETPEHGTPDEMEANLGGLHDELREVPDEVQESDQDRAAVEIAVLQGLYFETPSAHVGEVNVFKPSDSGTNCFNVGEGLNEKERIELGIECDTDVPEGIMGPNLLALRRIFSDNKNTAMDRNRRSGKVNAKVLGKRAWSNDDRLFQKKRVPAKRDYAVLIGIDISSSTLGTNLALAKRAAMAQAELCSRLGIRFAVFAHCCGITRDGRDRSFSMDIYHIKDFDQPWSPQAKSALDNICGFGGNLDGHTMEYYRKQLDRVEATDKILLYYTDGKMPAANHAEELAVLQREIRTCRNKKYTLLGVGIRTDSPVRHGLDTVQVEDDDDLKRVVDHLGKRLARPGR